MFTLYNWLWAISLKQDIFFRCWLYICDAQNSDIGNFPLITFPPEKLFFLNLFHYFSVSFFPTWGISLYLYSYNTVKTKKKTTCHSMYSDLNDETYSSAEMGATWLSKIEPWPLSWGFQRWDWPCMTLAQLQNSAWPYFFLFFFLLWHGEYFIFAMCFFL